MSDKYEQYPIKVSLIIKAASEDDAVNEVFGRFSKWMQETPIVIEGFGYPYGSLLYFSIADSKGDAAGGEVPEVDVALAGSSMVQSQSLEETAEDVPTTDPAEFWASG